MRDGDGKKAGEHVRRIMGLPNRDDPIMAFEDEVEQVLAERDEAIDLLEHAYLGFMYYSTSAHAEDCGEYLRKHGRLIASA